MSILLEALRKSEKSQQPREAPSIQSGDQSGPASEPLRTVPLVLLLVVALFFTGWFVWRQYQPPAGSYQPPVTLAAKNVRSDRTPVAVDKVKTPQKPLDQPADNSEGKPRTPVESYEPPVSDVVQSTPGSARPSNASRPSNRPGGFGLKPNASRAVATKKPVVKAKQEYRPQKPEPISYWELPDAIRSDVPEIKFSVLVYAADPAERFVLVNGQRLGEGDETQPGLVVEEIRLDGVVFSYRLYQFLVER
jgi:general secretion pathway protein B